MENGETVHTRHLERANIVIVDFFNAFFHLHVHNPTNQTIGKLRVTITNFNLGLVLEGKPRKWIPRKF